MPPFHSETSRPEIHQYLSCGLAELCGDRNFLQMKGTMDHARSLDQPWL